MIPIPLLLVSLFACYTSSPSPSYDGSFDTGPYGASSETYECTCDMYYEDASYYYTNTTTADVCSDTAPTSADVASIENGCENELEDEGYANADCSCSCYDSGSSC